MLLKLKKKFNRYLGICYYKNVIVFFISYTDPFDFKSSDNENLAFVYIFKIQIKAKDYSFMFFFAHIKGRAQCYFSLHSNIHEYLSHDEINVWNTCRWTTKHTCILHKLPICTTNTCVLSFHIILQDLYVFHLK